MRQGGSRAEARWKQAEPGVPAGESMARNKMKHFFRMDGDKSAAVFALVRMGVRSRAEMGKRAGITGAGDVCWAR